MVAEATLILRATAAISPSSSPKRRGRRLPFADAGSSAVEDRVHRRGRFTPSAAASLATSSLLASPPSRLTEPKRFVGEWSAAIRWNRQMDGHPVEERSTRAGQASLPRGGLYSYDSRGRKACGVLTPPPLRFLIGMANVSARCTIETAPMGSYQERRIKSFESGKLENSATDGSVAWAHCAAGWGTYVAFQKGVLLCY